MERFIKLDIRVKHKSTKRQVIRKGLFLLSLFVVAIGYADDTQSPESSSSKYNTTTRWSESGALATYDGSLLVTKTSTVGQFSEEINVSTPIAPPSNHYRTFYSSWTDTLCGEDSTGTVNCFSGSIVNSNNTFSGNNTFTGSNLFTSTNTFISSFTVNGVTDASNALTGKVGEYVESVVSNVTATTSVQYKDIATLSLSAGDWEVWGAAQSISGASSTILFGMSIGTAGNAFSDQVTGSNSFEVDVATTAFQRYSFTLPRWRVNTASSVTARFKALFIYTGTAPTIEGARLSARRIR